MEKLSNNVIQSSKYLTGLKKEEVGHLDSKGDHHYLAVTQRHFQPRCSVHPGVPGQVQIGYIVLSPLQS